MEPTTFRNMDISELGDDCTPEDLHLFRRACERRQQETGEDDFDVTAWMWGDGDWDVRVNQIIAEPSQADPND